jgi:hypothetical protein
MIHDRILSPLNACSLEVLQTPLVVKSNNIHDNDEDHEKLQEDNGEQGVLGTSKYYHPLVIGCYQLNDKDQSNDGNNTAENDDAHNLKQESNTSGQLLVYLVCTTENTDKEKELFSQHHSPTSSSSHYDDSIPLFDISSPPSVLKFNQPIPILDIDFKSGILDGKWLQLQSYAVSKDDSIYLYAAACASGDIQIYGLPTNFHKREAMSDNKSIQDCTENDISILRYVCSSSSNDDIDIDSKKNSGNIHDDDASGDDDYSYHTDDESENSNQNIKSLCLSLAWDEMSHRIVSSYSGGSISVHQLIYNVTNDKQNDEQAQPTFRLHKTHEIQNAHVFFKNNPSEVWTTAFASNSHYSTYNNIIMSGGDDCNLKIWDLRLVGENNSSTKPINVIGTEEFSAGVTAISYHPKLQHIFAVGSYDECIRIYDIRMMTSSTATSEDTNKCLERINNVGGGIWRIKWHPIHVDTLLVGAMHGGCRILKSSCNLGALDSLIESYDMYETIVNNYEVTDSTIVTEFKEHGSMAYGADWIYSNIEEEKYFIEACASCSFYDRQAFIWSR